MTWWSVQIVEIMRSYWDDEHFFSVHIIISCSGIFRTFTFWQISKYSYFYKKTPHNLWSFWVIKQFYKFHLFSWNILFFYNCGWWCTGLVFLFMLCLFSIRAVWLLSQSIGAVVPHSWVLISVLVLSCDDGHTNLFIIRLILRTCYCPAVSYQKLMYIFNTSDLKWK